MKNQARLKAIEGKASGKRLPILKCWLEDGTVECYDLFSAYGRLIEDDGKPRIIRAVCVENGDIATDAVETFLNLI